jgi:phage terminase large subunit-like protein
LGAAIELYMLLADGEGAPQIYNAATSRSQASLAYGAAWRMVRQSPKLMKHLRKGTVTERAENGIICDGNMGYAIVLSKQTDHLDGLDVHFALMDEMAAMEDRSIFDLVKQGMGAREQPLMVAITTQGFVRDNIWDHERDYAVRWLDGSVDDDRFLGILFEQDDRSEIWDERMWPKSNPGLGSVKKVEYLRSQVIKAKNDSSYMPTLLTKDFNLPANQASAYLTFDEEGALAAAKAADAERSGKSAASSIEARYRTWDESDGIALRSDKYRATMIIFR